MAKTIKMINKTGFIKSLLITVNNCDPKKAETKAHIAIIAKSLQSIFTFLRYCEVAKAVPLNAGIFSVPIIVETGKLGKKASDNGVCINPPPPTIESMKPAQKAAMHK